LSAATKTIALGQLDLQAFASVYQQKMADFTQVYLVLLRIGDCRSLNTTVRLTR
jgi:hypothetical protein